jgi:uncharacterized membrane protein YphA (DoxX/SURF4 family)
MASNTISLAGLRPHRALSALISFLLASVFCFSGFAKLFDVNEFQYTVAGLFGVQPREAFILSISLCVVEIALGIAVLIHRSRYFAAIAILVLTLAFSSLHVWAYASDAVLECKCFGDLVQGDSSLTAIIRNVPILLSSWILVRLSEHEGMTGPD